MALFPVDYPQTKPTCRAFVPVKPAPRMCRLWRSSHSRRALYEGVKQPAANSRVLSAGPPLSGFYCHNTGDGRFVDDGKAQIGSEEQREPAGRRTSL